MSNSSRLSKPNSTNLFSYIFFLTLFSQPSTSFPPIYQYLSQNAMSNPNLETASSRVLFSNRNREKLSILLYISAANASQKKNGFFCSSILESIYIYIVISIIIFHILFWSSVSYFPFLISASPTLYTFSH